jgi:hypothetical protein
LFPERLKVRKRRREKKISDGQSTINGCPHNIAIKDHAQQIDSPTPPSLTSNRDPPTLMHTISQPPLSNSLHPLLSAQPLQAAATNTAIRHPD